MSEASYVELPVIAWMRGESPTLYRAGGTPGGGGGGLGWTCRDEAAIPADPCEMCWRHA